MTAGPDEDVVLETLTDEELAVLGGPSSVVVNPFLDERNIAPGSAELEPLVRTAYRGLLARGIVEPPTPDALLDAARERHLGNVGDDPAGVDLQVRGDVLAAVTLRRAARAVVMAARTTSTAQDFWYAHVHEEVALLEEVSGDGLHHFALSRTARLAERFVAAVVHPDAADGRGDPITVGSEELGDGTPPTALLEVLGAAFVRADVVVRSFDDGGDPRLLGLYSGPEGSWVVDAGQRGRRADVVARPVTAAELRDTVVGLLARIDGAVTERTT